jgi:hypothetical protein
MNPLQTGLSAWVTNPALMGATDNPVPTYTTRQGYYLIQGSMCFVAIDLATSTMTKTTTTDNVLISLPVPCANPGNLRIVLPGYAYNGTPVENGTGLEILGGNLLNGVAYGTLIQDPLTAAEAPLTYGTGSLGVLTHVIKAVFSGWYPIY